MKSIRENDLNCRCDANVNSLNISIPVKHKPVVLFRNGLQLRKLFLLFPIKSLLIGVRKEASWIVYLSRFKPFF